MWADVGWAMRLLERQYSGTMYETGADVIIFRIQFLQDIKAFFGTSFKIVSANPSNLSCTESVYSCYGVGYVNVNRTLA